MCYIRKTGFTNPAAVEQIGAVFAHVRDGRIHQRWDVVDTFEEEKEKEEEKERKRKMRRRRKKKKE